MTFSLWMQLAGVMSRYIENYEFLERGSGEFNFLKKYYRYTRKRIRPRETRKNLLQTASILISATVFSYGDITLETTGILKISMAKLKHFWPFFAIFLSEN